MYFSRGVLLLLVAVFAVPSWQRSILDTIREEDELSSFRSLLFRYDVERLLQGNLTIFAPTNEAFAKYWGILNEKILLNHIVNWELPLDTLDSRTRLITQDNYPTLFVTRGQDFIYVNNAKLDFNQQNYVVSLENEKRTIQILYAIDEVLAPVLLTPSYRPAKALDFMSLRLHDFSHFFTAIIDNGASSLYTSSNRNTYFIPLNTPSSGLHRNEIDLSILRGHIVPYHALFTRPSAKNFPFPTMYQESLNVILRIFEDDDKLYVESETVYDGSISRIIAEIVEANIPVENGVVHVVNTTLVVLSRTPNVFPYLTMDYKLSGDPSLNFSNTLTQKAGFYKLLAENVQMTFFVPRDEAWSSYTDKGKGVLEYCAPMFFRKQMVVGETAYRMKDLELLSRTSEITLNSMGGIIQIKVKKLEDSYYYLRWKDTKIRVYRSDYACANGYIHIVDSPFLATCDLINCRKEYFAHIRNVSKMW